MIFGNVRNEFFEQQAAVLPKPLCEALHVLKDMDLAGHDTVTREDVALATQFRGISSKYLGAGTLPRSPEK